jgi:hypothetical protein
LAISWRQRAATHVCSAGYRQEIETIVHVDAFKDLLSHWFQEKSWGSPRGVSAQRRGKHMPAFTFEKLAPPAPRTPAPPDVKKRRWVMVRMIDRFAGMRARRIFFRKKTALNSHQPKP